MSAPASDAVAKDTKPDVNGNSEQTADIKPSKPVSKKKRTPTVKNTALGIKDKGGASSNPEMVVALFEKVLARATPDDVGEIAARYGVEKRLVGMSFQNRWRPKALKLIRDGFATGRK